MFGRKKLLKEIESLKSHNSLLSKDCKLFANVNKNLIDELEDYRNLELWFNFNKKGNTISGVTNSSNLRFKFCNKNSGKNGFDFTLKVLKKNKLKGYKK